MKKFLRISTPGECDVEAFTVLGASSSRGDEGTIGQFGSGAKHAILCCLRAAVGLIICVGRTKIVPQTQPQTIHGQLQQRVQFRIGNKTEASSMVLDFGSLDWTDPVAMALRELFSNALDAVGGDWSQIEISTCDQPRAKAGWTTVYVEQTREVEAYLAILHERFLHVSGKQNLPVIAKENRGPVKCYRKGVFVRELEITSIFDYNFGDNVPIDESRNLDSYRVRCFAASTLCLSLERTRDVVRYLIRNPDSNVFESEFSEYHLDRSVVAEAIKKECGDDVHVTYDHEHLIRGKAKKLNCVLLPVSWAGAAASGGVPSVSDVLTVADNKGLATFAASSELLANVQYVFYRLLQHNLTGQLRLDNLNIVQYQKPMNAGETLCGFYDRSANTIGISTGHVGNYSTILEELSHWITQAADETRDLQTFAFQVAARLMEGEV